VRGLTGWFLLAAISFPMTSARGQAADSLAARGDSALAAGDAAGALEAFDAALRERPDDPELLRRRGRALREQGRLDAALAAYSRAIAVDSTEGAAYAGRAFTRHLLGQPDSAWLDVNRARPGIHRSGAGTDRGRAAGGMQRYAESEVELDAFIAAVPDVPDGWFFRGVVRARQGKVVDALRDLERAEATGMTGPNLYVERAGVQGRIGNREAACADLRRAADAGHAGAKAEVARICR
jgi:tetratricopeptide (TPR) repeat protein